MTNIVRLREQVYDRSEHAVERAFHALRNELQAIKEAAQRIEAIVAKLKTKERPNLHGETTKHHQHRQPRERDKGPVG